MPCHAMPWTTPADAIIHDGTPLSRPYKMELEPQFPQDRITVSQPRMKLRSKKSHLDV